VLVAIIKEDLGPIEANAPHVPAPVQWLIERLLAKDAGGRFDSRCHAMTITGSKMTRRCRQTANVRAALGRPEEEAAALVAFRDWLIDELVGGAAPES
jgi:hypothetical protein